MGRLVALLLLFALPAYAGNGISGITTQKWRSLTSVAIKAVVSGDNDSSAVLRLFQRWQGAPAFDTGMVLVRRAGTNIHEGRILWMTPGKTAEWWIEGTDASGGRVTCTDTASCAVVRGVVATGPVFYVNQATGNNANPGTLALPTKSINAALTLLAASANSGRDGGVIVAPGHYHERLSLNFGTDGYHRFLMGDGTNRDSTIICGANEHGEAGRYDATTALAWTFTGQDSTYKAYFPAAATATSFGDSIGSVILGWGEWLHRKTSIKAVLDDSTLVSWVGLNTGELSGWYWQNDTLYVKRKNGASPAGLPLHIGYREKLVEVAKRNWRISRLTIRYGGNPVSGATYKGYPTATATGYGILAGNSGNGSGLVVDSCRVYGHNNVGVYARYSGSTVRGDTVTVANTIVDGLTIGSMAYAATKGRNEETAGLIRLTGSGSNIYRCTVTELANGIQNSPAAGIFDSTWAMNAEIAENTVTRISDDAIELDATHSINQLVVKNTTNLSGCGVSATGIPTGPLFIIENTLANFSSAGVKIGGNVSRVGIYQNTMASTIDGSRAFEGQDSGTQLENVTCHNNIFWSNVSGNDGTINGPATGGASNVFNWNLLYKPAPANMVWWGGAGMTFAAWQASGREVNGAFGDPLLLDLAGGDYRPTTASPALVLGRRLTGINTSMDGPRYTVVPRCGSLGCGNCGCY